MNEPTNAPDTDALNRQMLNAVRETGLFLPPAIEHAFLDTPRHHFLPDLPLADVYKDEAIAAQIAEDGVEWLSSSSQPTIMAIMLEQLGIEPGMRVLEIGTGTGYNAALLAKLTGSGEHVWTVDVTPHLCDEAEQHLRAAGVEGVHVSCGDGWLGWPEAAPFDRIIVTASAYDVAPAWFEQLAEGGRLVLPWGAPMIGQRAMAFEKQGGALVLTSSHTCGFMRLRGASDWQGPSTEADEDRQSGRWEIPIGSGLPSPFTVLNEFLHFLSLFVWPLTPMLLVEDGTADGSKIHFADRRSRLTAHLSIGDTWTVSGSGGESFAETVGDAVRQWFTWEQPAPERLAMTGWPRGQAPEVAAGERLARREWFDYVVKTHPARAPALPEREGEELQSGPNPL